MPHRLACITVITLAVACGTRTPLFSEESSAAQPTDGGVSFDAGCQEPLWLLFNLRNGSDTPTSGIYAMRADGSAGHMLSLPHAPGFNPSVSPDGSKLLYATFMQPTEDGGADSALYLFDFASQSATEVVTTVGLTYSALSPDEQTVSYVSYYDLRAIDAVGTNDRLLIAGPNGCGTGYGHPVFESDSQTIVYGTGGIVGAIGDDGSNNTTLLEADPGSFEYPNPAFSPDYQSIVAGVYCDETPSGTLSVYPFASLPGASCGSGQVLTDVTNGSSSNEANDPSWGTNGFIAYGSGKDVFVIEASGGTPRNMTAELTGDAGVVTAADPVWAPGCAFRFIRELRGSRVPGRAPGHRSESRWRSRNGRGCGNRTHAS